jgi:hypothetical protein
MNLENIILSELGQSKEDKTRDSTYMRQLNKPNSEKQREKWWFAGGGGWWETGEVAKAAV